MSTRAIVALIQEMRRIGTEEQAELAVRALAEATAIERAAKAWWMRDDVMERIEDAGHGGFDVVRSIAKDAP